MFGRTPNVPPIEGTVNVGCGWTASVWIFGAAGWCAANQLRLNQTIRNLTCGDLEILLLVIWVTGLKKKNRFSFCTCLVERGGEVVWFSVCEVLLDGWANGGSVHVFFTYGEYRISSYAKVLYNFFNNNIKNIHIKRCSWKSHFTRKYLCCSLFCNKAVGCRLATSLKTESCTGDFLWILRHL